MKDYIQNICFTFNKTISHCERRSLFQLLGHDTRKQNGFNLRYRSKKVIFKNIILWA